MLYVRQTWMTQLILAIFLSVRFYYSLCERTSFAWNLSLESFLDPYLYFGLALLHSVSYLFFLYWSPSLSLCMLSYSTSSNIHEVLLIKSSANVFDFWDFAAHDKDWQIYSGGTDGPGNSHSLALLDLFIYSDTSIYSTMAFAPLGNLNHVVV